MVVENDSYAGGDVEGFFGAVHREADVGGDDMQCFRLNAVCFIAEDVEWVLCSVVGIGNSGRALFHNHRCPFWVLVKCFFGGFVLFPLYCLLRAERCFCQSCVFLSHSVYGCRSIPD